MGRKRRKDKVHATVIPAKSTSVANLPAVDLPRPLVLLLVCLLFAGLSIWEMAGDSVTGDERIHLPVGYAYWKKREFRLNPEHPPAVKLLASAPLLAMNIQMPSTEPDPSNTHTDEYKAFNLHQEVFGSEFLFIQDADRIIFWGRLPLVALGLLLGFFIYWWSRKLHGHASAGLLSLFLFAMEPTIIAHSHYVTTDVALACFSIIAMFFLWRFSQEAKLRYLTFSSLGLGLALASKFSAIFLAPVFFFLLFLQWPAEGLATSHFPGRHNSFKIRVLAAGYAALMAAVIVQASYLFSTDLLLYFKGIRTTNLNHNPTYPYYIHGNFIPGGVWWYPLYAFLLKTPLPTMIAIFVATVFHLKARQSMPRGLTFLLLPAAVYTLAVCAFADNLGVRYTIPVTAFLLVLAGASWIPSTASLKGRILAGILVIWLMVSVLRVSPHYISYFNELIGGPENAPYYLDDSNVDWGQDLKRLMHHLSKNQIKEVVLGYWGPSPPEYYGDRYGIQIIPWTRTIAGSPNPPPGVYAVSVNELIGAKEKTLRDYRLGRNMDWLERFKPSDRVGYSIYIYRFPEAKASP